MIGHSTSRVTQRDWLLRPSLTKSDANCRATTRRGALLLGNDAWKGVELGVESSLRWRDEFKSFTRKVKAINDTDDVVDEVVIFSNKRFTREIEIGRERETPSFFSPSLSLSNAYFARNIAARLHLSSRISTISSSSSRKLEKWKRRGGKKRETEKRLMQDRRNSAVHLGRTQ